MAKKPIALRIDPDLEAASKEVAKLESRTLTNLIEVLLRERCEKHGVPIGK